MTSNSKAQGRFGKQDFRYLAEEDVYICPAGEKLAYRYTTEENGLVLRRYWTNACQSCAIKQSCTTGKERRIARWDHEYVLEAVQRRLDEHPEKMRLRRSRAQQPAMPVIGVVSGQSADADARNVAAFRKGLNETAAFIARARPIPLAAPVIGTRLLERRRRMSTLFPVGPLHSYHNISRQARESGPGVGTLTAAHFVDGALAACERQPNS